MATASRGPRRRERQTETPRSRLVKLTYTEDERALVQAAADRAGMAVAAWVARAALDVAADLLVPVSTNARSVLEELIRSRGQLGRIGNNLNQIALVLNSGGRVPSAQLAAVLRLVEEAVRRTDEATLQVMRERRPR
jgi:Bacterial mobilisation protein (MobC)